jgi:hypothetical protein
MVVGDDCRCGSATASSCGAALLQEDGRKRIGDRRSVLRSRSGHSVHEAAALSYDTCGAQRERRGMRVVSSRGVRDLELSFIGQEEKRRQYNGFDGD